MVVSPFVLYSFRESVYVIEDASHGAEVGRFIKYRNESFDYDFSIVVHRQRIFVAWGKVIYACAKPDERFEY